MTAMIPMGAERDSSRDLDRLRYYRLVMPMEPDKPPLSSHPLTWTTISHIVWDGLPPDVLSVSQQQAILDWLHWGGQLIFTGGAGQSYALYHDSFLGPYLPADASGQTVGLTQEDLRPLSQSYPPPTEPDLPMSDGTEAVPGVVQGFGRIYQAPAPIAVAARQAGVPVGAPTGCGCLDHPAGRGEPPSPGRREPGRARADHHADDQPARAGVGGLARPRHLGPSRRPPSARGEP